MNASTQPITAPSPKQQLHHGTRSDWCRAWLSQFASDVPGLLQPMSFRPSHVASNYFIGSLRDAHAMNAPGGALVKKLRIRLVVNCCASTLGVDVRSGVDACGSGGVGAYSVVLEVGPLKGVEALPTAVVAQRIDEALRVVRVHLLDDCASTKVVRLRLPIEDDPTFPIFPYLTSVGAFLAVTFPLVRAAVAADAGVVPQGPQQPSELSASPKENSPPQTSESAHRSDGAVLVHCAAGKSRSVAIVLASLLHQLVRHALHRSSAHAPVPASDAVQSALAWLQRRRRFAMPNPGFMHQLCTLVDALAAPRSHVDEDE